MSVGAAEATMGAASADELPEEKIEEIKAANSASENYGNFYGQNLSPVQSGILLVVLRMKDLGYDVDPLRLVMFTIPIVAISIVLAVFQFLMLDRRLAKKEEPR
jgi:uncharacterized membrane protein